MDSSKKYQIDQWVEDVLYGKLGEVMAKRQITAMDATTLTPLVQMYQAIQLKNVYEELESLWRLFADGDAGISIQKTVDVNVKQMPQDGSQQQRKGR